MGGIGRALGYLYRGAMHSTTSIAGPLGLVWAIPFAGLLLTIAVTPLVAPRFWHHHYGKAATLWALAFLVPDAARRGFTETLTTVTAVALHEYLPFILLLGALFAVAGGIRIKGAPRASPLVNTALLGLGTVTASWIGTTGAAMILIRPLIRANRRRASATHVFVFFILLVANVGGALTPLGDPPLFLGYLLGVPFFWPAVHLLAPTIVVAGGLLTVFYALDWMVTRRASAAPVTDETEALGIEGIANLLLLAAVVATVLLRGIWHPAFAVAIFGVAWGLGEAVSTALLLVIAGLSLATTPKAARAGNEFTWGPMIEVAILFAAIFVTLQPALAMIAEGPNGPAGPLIVHLFDGTANVPMFFWATGILSAFLDNAPTYVVFFDFGGGDPAQLTSALAPVLTAISMGAVYFGALTYIGNAPNLMVKAIVESQGLKMPSFFGYLGWACLCLMPWLALVDWLFLR